KQRIPRRVCNGSGHIPYGPPVARPRDPDVVREVTEIAPEPTLAKRIALGVAFEMLRGAGRKEHAIDIGAQSAAFAVGKRDPAANLDCRHGGAGRNIGEEDSGPALL